MFPSVLHRRSTVIAVPNAGMKWKSMKQLLTLKLQRLSLQEHTSKVLCQFWVAQIVVKKQWNMSSTKGPPEGR